MGTRIFIRRGISIHALREERDGSSLAFKLKINGFQSTRSARSATPAPAAASPQPSISIHALREERDPMKPCQCGQSLSISIHALREERDRIAHNAFRL